MKVLKDPTQNAMRNIVDPFLKSEGFQRTKERLFLRVRGEFVDCVHIGFGRWGSDSIYVYFSVHLIADPILNIYSYEFGDRTSIKWFPKSHEKALAAAGVIVQEIRRCALPWFECIASIEQYEGATNQYAWESALCALLGGDEGRALVYLGNGESAEKQLPYVYGYPEPQWDQEELERRSNERLEFSQLKKALVKAVLAGEFRSWADSNRASNLVKLGLR